LSHAHSQIGFHHRVRLVNQAQYNKLVTKGEEFQVTCNGWGYDYPSAFNIFQNQLVCPDFRPHSAQYSNTAGFCNPSIDREVMRAASAQINDPQRAADLWSQVDRDVVDEAGWVPFYNYQSVEFVSKRVGNYQYNPWWRSLLDQLWVR